MACCSRAAMLMHQEGELGALFSSPRGSRLRTRCVTTVFASSASVDRPAGYRSSHKGLEGLAPAVADLPRFASWRSRSRDLTHL